MVSYIVLHSQTFTLNNLRCLVKDHLLCVTTKSTQPSYRKSFLPYFPSSPSFLICYHLSLSLSSLPHLHYPPPSSLLLSLSLSSASFSLYLRLLAAFLVVEPRPRPSGRGVPDGLAGRRFTTDPSAADPVLPQTPGGPGGNTYLKQDERQRTGEGPGAEGELRNSRTCHLLHLIIKQSEAVSLKVPALRSLKHKHTLCYHSSAV